MVLSKLPVLCEFIRSPSCRCPKFFRRQSSASRLDRSITSIWSVVEKKEARKVSLLDVIKFRRVWAASATQLAKQQHTINTTSISRLLPHYPDNMAFLHASLSLIESHDSFCRGYARCSERLMPAIIEEMSCKDYGLEVISNARQWLSRRHRGRLFFLMTHRFFIVNQPVLVSYPY